MPKTSAWIIDPPSPFAPRAEWEAHLAELLAAKKERRTKAFDGAIAEARRALSGGADPGLGQGPHADPKPGGRRKP